MKKLETLEIWFVTGSQHLYGKEALAKVAANAQKISCFARIRAVDSGQHRLQRGDDDSR